MDTENNGLVKIIIIAIVGFFMIKSCDNRNKKNDYSNETSSTWTKSPVDEIIEALKNEQNYSIILSDMDYVNSQYKHNYNVVVEREDTVVAQETGWREVSPTFFAANEQNMGMEIVSRKDGKLSKVASPAGYNHYVGNEKYGHWEERNGSSFWAFYGRYAFMSSMFNMMMPVRRGYYNDYYGGGYYGRKSYYGPSGNPVYGTNSYTSSTAGKKSTWGSKSSSFKSDVQSKAKRSASASSSRTYNSSSKYSNTSSSSRNTRTSSRYSSSSSRSRSGGYGK